MKITTAGAVAVALLALFGTVWPAAAEADDDDTALQQNLAMQQMIQAEQQAEQQNEQAQQQFLQDELQAQQTEQQANP
jgi:septal ring factor EnvC (AmiA/AmiB activator)